MQPTKETAATGVNISGGIVAEFGRLARNDGLNVVRPDRLWCWDNASDIDKGKKMYPCEPPAVINWIMLYSLADWEAAEQIKVLDGAHRFGLKIVYDLSRRGISTEKYPNGLDNETARWLHSNISVVKDHPALLGYYICGAIRIVDL
jgi:hypothetical protein